MPENRYMGVESHLTGYDNSTITASFGRKCPRLRIPIYSGRVFRLEAPTTSSTTSSTSAAPWKNNPSSSRLNLSQSQARRSPWRVGIHGKNATGTLFDRRHSIGGSDARIIMGKDEKALTRLWKEKRGEVERTDLSDVLIVQMGLVTDDLNRRWYE